LNCRPAPGGDVVVVVVVIIVAIAVAVLLVVIFVALVLQQRGGLEARADQEREATGVHGAIIHSSRDVAQLGSALAWVQGTG
jgi:hypothetical protein